MAKNLLILLIFSFSLNAQLVTSTTSNGGGGGGGGAGFTGSGTANVVTKFTGTTALGNSGISDNGTTISWGENFTSTAAPATSGVWAAYFGAAIGGFTSAIQTELNLSSNAFTLLNSTPYANTLRVVNQENGNNANAVPLSSHQSCSGTMNACNGIEGTIDITGGTTTAATGSGEQVNVSAGTATAAYGFLNYPMTASGTGTITLGYGALFAAPTTSGSGVITTYVPIEANGRPGGTDAAYLVDTGLIVAPTSRSGAGITNSYLNTLEASTFDTVVHNVDWGTSVVPTSNAGASIFHIQSRVDAGSFTDRLTISDAGLVTAPGGFSGTGHQIPFSLGDPSGIVLVAASTTYDLSFPTFACTIKGYRLAGDTGTFTVKFMRKVSGTAIPTVSDSINTSGVSLASGTAVESTTVTDFTSTAIVDGDIVGMIVTVVSGTHYITGTLTCVQ